MLLLLLGVFAIFLHYFQYFERLYGLPRLTLIVKSVALIDIKHINVYI